MIGWAARKMILVYISIGFRFSGITFKYNIVKTARKEGRRTTVSA